MKEENKNEKPLAQIYIEAVSLTNAAAESIMNGDTDSAIAALNSRAKLMRDIQKNISCAPKWGTDSVLDQQALKYIAADNRLCEIIERLTKA